jgi:hypothetical protein
MADEVVVEINADADEALAVLDHLTHGGGTDGR